MQMVGMDWLKGDLKIDPNYSVDSALMRWSPMQRRQSKQISKKGEAEKL